MSEEMQNENDRPKLSKTGGPAFPQHGWTSNPEVLKRMEGQGGLSVRDYFAAKAMQSLIPGYADNDPKHATSTANAAYEFADAMIVARSGLI